MFDKMRFKQFVSSHEIIEYSIFDARYTIKLPLDEIKKKRLSKILAQQINDQKAFISGNDAYIIPNYDERHTPPSVRKLRKGRLLHCVEEKSFVSMMNQAEMVVSGQKGKEKKYYLKLGQSLVRKYQCVQVVAALLEENLAKIEGNSNDVYIDYNYQKRLMEATMIRGDLLHFRTLLGESGNLAALLEVVEKGEIREKKIHISHDLIQDAELNIELMSLCDIGIAALTQDGFEVDFKFASWLLEHVSNTSDRLSFSSIYDS